MKRFFRWVGNFIAWVEREPGYGVWIIKPAGKGELEFPPPIDTGIPIHPYFGQFLDGPEGWIIWDWYKDHHGPHALVRDDCGCHRAVYTHPGSNVMSTMFTIPCAAHYNRTKSWTAARA